MLEFKLIDFTLDWYIQYLAMILIGSRLRLGHVSGTVLYDMID